MLNFLSIFGSYDLAIGSYDLESAISDLAIWAKYDLKKNQGFYAFFISLVFIFSIGIQSQGHPRLQEETNNDPGKPQASSTICDSRGL